jgi:hypothetical protein
LISANPVDAVLSKMAASGDSAAKNGLQLEVKEIW